MIINDLDLGSSHPWLSPTTGQQKGEALVKGRRTIAWTDGGIVEQEDIEFAVTAWQSIGGQTAGTKEALAFLIRQLEELGNNADMNPVLIRWTSSAQSGAYNVPDPHDGWYVIDSVQPDYSHNWVSGTVKVTMTATRIGPPPPAPLNILGTGSLVATFSLPVGAVGAGAFPYTRVGGEGTIPLVELTDGRLNPLPVIPSSTVGNMFLGGVRLYDTVTAGSNAVPTGGTFVHATWVQIYGPDHNLAGDLILTNGLQLWRFNLGSGIDYYVWNSTAWKLMGTLAYRDSGLITGIVRSFSNDIVGILRTRIIVGINTSAGNFCYLAFDMRAGAFDTAVNWEIRTEDNSRGLGVELVLTTAIKVVANTRYTVDVATQGTTSLTPDTLTNSINLIFAVGISATTGTPLVGIQYDDYPNSGQPLAQSTTEMGVGDTTSPLLGDVKVYGIYAAPYAGGNQNLLSEAESGTLDVGWTSAADAGSSGGNAAKLASATVTARADRFGTSFVPTPGTYDIRFRARVTSAAGTTSEIQIGLWDTTSSAFVALGSTIYRASQMATGYGWFSVCRRIVTDGVTNGTTTITSATANFTSADVGKLVQAPLIGTILFGTTISSVTPPTTAVLSTTVSGSASGVTFVIGDYIVPAAGHNMQIRAVSTATVGTDYWIDQGAMIPLWSALFGAGNLPADIAYNNQANSKSGRSWVRV